MTATTFDRPGAFRIGKVFSDSFAVLGRNLPLVIGLAAILSGIPTLLFQLGFGVTPTGSFQDPDALAAGAVLMAAGGLLSLVLSSVMQAALIRAAIEDMNGAKPSFGDCLNTAFAVLLPTIGIALLVTIGIGLGLVLLIVPGVILWLRWSVAIPALVQERRGVFGSMKRSAALTKGSRWALFGFYIVLVIALILLQIVLGSVTAMLSGMAAVLFGTLVSMIGVVMLSIAGAVSYVELRLVREGTSVSDLAEIFS